MTGCKYTEFNLIDSWAVHKKMIDVLKCHFASSVQEYMVENEALRTENSEHLQIRDRMKRDQQHIVRENDRLQRKVEELQR